ncbi:MAG: C25 family cysteine peptidase, partial [Chloroflexi bacterium]|nr:C25 family cysteine peptidase [Chloroflexota bacterium]
MRSVLRALAASLTATLVLLSTLAPVSAANITPVADSPGDTAAPSGAKVVIIVGPTHGLTNSNREDADEAYAEALKWTSNVYRYYSPTATWATVKAALAGANIVIYLGHGNGWPSPYTYDPNYTTKDGFGLNNPSNKSDNVVQYYGEPYIDDLALAPGAVVILNHACYTSGASEPGHPEPSLSVAKQRVDNFGAAFLKVGASAVISAYKGSAANYLNSLFTTRSTVFDAWRWTQGYRGHEISFASVRRPGKTAILDPDTSGGGGYNRSIVGNPATLVSSVVGQLATDGDPSSLVVPGAAEIAAGGATLQESEGEWSDEVGSLSEGAKVRVIEAGWGGSDGDGDAGGRYLIENGDGSLTGWVDGNRLVPRDSAAPGFFNLSASPGQMYSGGTWNLNATLSESVQFLARLYAPDGAKIKSSSGTGSSLSMSWNGTVEGATGPNGKYKWTIDAVDPWGNWLPQKTGSLWFRDNTLPGTYITLPPTRLLDSGLGVGMAAGPFPANTPKTFP